MKRPSFFRNCRPLAVILALSIPPLSKQTLRGDETGPPDEGEIGIPQVELHDPEKLGKTGDAALLREDWLTAAANYNGLLTIGRKVGMNPEDLEPLCFVIPVCLFNQKQYGEALARCKEYEQMYPKGPNIDKVKLLIGSIHYAQKKNADAIKYFKPLSDQPGMRDEVLVALASAYKANQEPDRAIVLLETKLAAELKSSGDVRAALCLIDLYDAQPAKGLVVLEKLKKAPGVSAFAAEINVASMKLAEVQMQEKFYEGALRAFQTISRRQEALAALKSRVEEYEKDLTALSGGEGRKKSSLPNIQKIIQLKSFRTEAKALMAALEKEDDYDAVVTWRMGRCLTALQRYPEACSAFREVYGNHPKFSERPNALYALAYCSYMQVPENPAKNDLKKVEEVDKLLVEFLTKYGKGDRAELLQAADMRITLATRTKDVGRLNNVIEDLIAQFKGTPAWPSVMVSCIHNQIEQKNFEKAKDLIDRFLEDAPADDSHIDQVREMREQIRQKK